MNHKRGSPDTGKKGVCWEREAWQAIMRPGHWQQIHGMGNSNLFLQQATAAQAGTPHSAFRASYLPAQQAAAALADPSTLAVFGFNAGLTLHDAPHWLQVPLAIHGADRIEVWQGDTAAEHGTSGAVQWSRNAELLFTSIEVAEVDGDIEAATGHPRSTVAADLHRAEALSGYCFMPEQAKAIPQVSE